MKYYDILQSKMEQLSKKVKIKGNSEEYVNDWAIIAVCLEFPEEKPNVLISKLSNKYNIHLDMNSLCDRLKKYDIYFHSKRRSMLIKSKKFSETLCLLLEGNADSFDYLDKFCTNAFDLKDKGVFIAKSVLVWSFIFDKQLKSNMGLEIVKNCGEAYCGKLIREIVVEVGNKIGKKRRRNIKQVLDESKDIFDLQLSTQNANLISDKDKQIETLKFDLNNYKNALETIQAMFEDLKDGVEVAANEAKEIAVTEFFAKMNSSDYGNILDNLITVQKSLKECRKQKIMLPPQLMPLSIIFSQIIKFVGDSKITTIDTVGREFETDYEGIDGFAYTGSEFVTEDEKKYVVVTSPGWKYEDAVISIPTIKEKLDV